MKKFITLGLTLVLSLIMIVGAALPVSADALDDLCTEFPISGTTFSFINHIQGSPTYITATLGGDDWLDGIYDGWCARTDQSLTAGDSWIAYCSYNLPADPSLIQYPAHLPKVNWILNQTWAPPITYADIQVAIWALLGFDGDKLLVPQAALDDVLGEDMTADGRVDTILAGANANPAYEPPAGGKLVVVVKPAQSSVVFSVQTVLITVDIPDEPGDEGCTPGFWKGNADNKGASAWVDYVPGDDFSAIFGIPEQTLRANGKNTYTNPTLRQALDANGSGINLLARSAVAALLNAANPDIAYPMTESEIIEAVQDAIAGEGAYTIQELGELLDSYNNLGCPIDQQWD